MATYRALQDMWLGGNWPYVTAGTILTDGPGGNLPNGWVPNGAVDPLDTAAVNAFWAAGPQIPGLIRSQWTFIAPPVTYWVPTGTPGLRQYKLTGPGAALGVQQMGVNGASFGGIQP